MRVPRPGVGVERSPAPGEQGGTCHETVLPRGKSLPSFRRFVICGAKSSGRTPTREASAPPQIRTARQLGAEAPAAPNPAEAAKASGRPTSRQGPLLGGEVGLRTVGRGGVAPLEALAGGDAAMYAAEGCDSALARKAAAPPQLCTNRRFRPLPPTSAGPQRTAQVSGGSPGCHDAGPVGDMCRRGVHVRGNSPKQVSALFPTPTKKSGDGPAPRSRPGTPLKDAPLPLLTSAASAATPPEG